LCLLETDRTMNKRASNRLALPASLQPGLGCGAYWIPEILYLFRRANACLAHLSSVMQSCTIRERKKKMHFTERNEVGYTLSYMGSGKLERRWNHVTYLHSNKHVEVN
jgi:hypothetical protein